MTTAVPAVGDTVICADNEPLGMVAADEGTHLRVHRSDETPATVWVSKRLIAGVSGGTVRLMVRRDELHDGVISMPPNRQREYGTLEAMTLMLRRDRGQFHDIPNLNPAAPPISPGGIPD
jgi:hypothetical protein